MELTSIIPNPVTAANGVTSADAETATADFESFLTLLTAQLRNQDPLSPLDATEFVAQLASFSSVEQLVGVNERLDSFNEQMLSGTIASFSSWIGRDVAGTDGTFRYDGSPVRFEFDPASPTQTIVGTVRTASGTVLSQFAVEGTGPANWPGTQNAPIGQDLVMELEYFNDGVSQGPVPAAVLRRVTGLEGTAEGFVLTLEDGGTVGAHEVVRVRDAVTSPDA